MTIYDLLFVLLVPAFVGALGTAAVRFLRGQGARAGRIAARTAVCAVAYIAVVYAATAMSKPKVLGLREPECSDDWCLEVSDVEQSGAAYDVTLILHSRARRVAQREMVAKDVYLVDAEGRRFDPVRVGGEIPLNVLLQAGESVTTRRRFVLPEGRRAVGLRVERSSILPFCTIIGECEAFGKGTMVRIPAQ